MIFFGLTVNILSHKNYNLMIYIEDCNKKPIFGSFERSKLPPNITDYHCQLCIQQYAQGPVSEEIKYFRFTPKAGTKGEPFNINIDSIQKPKNLIYPYRITEKESQKANEPDLAFGDRIEFKMQTTVVEPPKKESNVQQLPQPDSDGEIFFRDIDQSRFNQNILRLQESGEEDIASGESKCVEPSQGDKGNIKTELTNYLHVEDNKFAKLKDIRIYLMNRGFKVSEGRLKGLLGEICKTNPSDRRGGFVLKDVFFSKEEYDRRNPKKKVKQE